MSGYSIGTANRITNDGVYTYSYDKEGNITKRSKGPTDETWFYGYDHLNHMIWAELRAEDDDQSTLLMRADYEYDALGRRIEKAVDADGDGGGGTTTTRFSYLSEPYSDVPILWADLDGSSSLTTRYLRGDAVDQIFARIGSGTPAWLLQDHIGSIRNVVNNSGTILATVVNDSYGNQTSAEDADTGDYRLAAMRWDAEKQSFSTLGRDFGPDFGGGYQEDRHEIDFVDGPNERPYVNNNPLMSTDPSGLVQLPKPGTGVDVTDRLRPWVPGKEFRGFWYYEGKKKAFFQVQVYIDKDTTGGEGANRGNIQIGIQRLFNKHSPDVLPNTDFHFLQFVHRIRKGLVRGARGLVWEVEKTPDFPVIIGEFAYPYGLRGRHVDSAHATDPFYDRLYASTKYDLGTVMLPLPLNPVFSFALRVGLSKENHFWMWDAPSLVDAEDARYTEERAIFDTFIVKGNTVYYHVHWERSFRWDVDKRRWIGTYDKDSIRGGNVDRLPVWALGDSLISGWRYRGKKLVEPPDTYTNPIAARVRNTWLREYLALFHMQIAAALR